MIRVIAVRVSRSFVFSPAPAKLAGGVGRRDQNILNEPVCVEFMSMEKSEPLENEEPDGKAREQGARNSIRLGASCAHRGFSTPDAACGQRERSVSRSAAFLIEARAAIARPGEVITSRGWVKIERM